MAPSGKSQPSGDTRTLPGPVAGGEVTRRASAPATGEPSHGPATILPITTAGIAPGVALVFPGHPGVTDPRAPCTAVAGELRGVPIGCELPAGHNGDHRREIGWRNHG